MIQITYNDGNKWFDLSPLLATETFGERLQKDQTSFQKLVDEWQLPLTPMIRIKPGTLVVVDGKIGTVVALTSDLKYTVKILGNLDPIHHSRIRGVPACIVKRDIFYFVEDQIWSTNKDRAKIMMYDAADILSLVTGAEVIPV